jgi:hypothetical protein
MDFVKIWYVKPEVLTAVLMKTQVLWDITSCRLVRSFRTFRRNVAPPRWTDKPWRWCNTFRRNARTRRNVPKDFSLHVRLPHHFRRNFLRVVLVLFYIISLFLVFRHWAANPKEKFKENSVKLSNPCSLPIHFVRKNSLWGDAMFVCVLFFSLNLNQKPETWRRLPFVAYIKLSNASIVKISCLWATVAPLNIVLWLL